MSAYLYIEGTATAKNYRVTCREAFHKLIKKAGVKQWPKLWQNLRASGCTDFARDLPSHVAAAICGHTEQIAKEHYWQVSDADLDSVINQQELTRSKTRSSKPQQALATHSTEVQPEVKTPGKSHILRENDGKQWTILDSNQRPPRCQRGALTN